VNFWLLQNHALNLSLTLPCRCGRAD
jgi:hypothetical protein